MKLLFCIILSSFAISSTAQRDTVIIRNFNTGSYKATSFNYMGLQARDGMYYFGNENGILQYDGSEWQLHTVKNYSGIFSMTEGENNTFYVGGYNEFGYVKKDSAGTLIYTSLRNKVSMDSTINEVWQTIIFNESVYFLSYDRILRWDGVEIHHISVKDAYLFPVNGKLYASVLNGNMIRLEGDSTIFVSDKIKFGEDAAFQILPGPANKHIIFTSFHGLYLFDENNGIIEKWSISANDLLIKSQLYSAIHWQDSLYACTTWTNGLIFLNKDGEVVKKITANDGLSTNSLREPMQDSRNNLWVASNFGITYLQWPELNQPASPPATIITKVTYKGETLITPYLSNLQVSYESPVTFHFATPGFDKDDLEYSYFLEGADAGWSEWNDDIKKEYRHINGGKYKFHVKARLLNDMESQPATLAYHVYKPWYLSNWFVVIIIMILVSSIYLLVRLRTLQLSRINRQLEGLVEERTAELVAQREQLRNVNKDLRTMNTELDNFVYRSSHDLVAPLKSLKGLINLAKMDNPGERQIHYLHIMNSSVLRLEDFIKSIMDYSVNAKREIELKEVTLDSIINEIVAEIKYFEKAERVDLFKEYKPDFIIKSDPSRLKIILSNLITNSVKYHNYDQPRPFIKVFASTTAEYTEVKIKDNGQGIPEEFLVKIFDMFFRASESAEGSGLGLYIVKDTVDKLGAKISVESKYGEGTTFTLKLGN
ncbi:ATP-binding protein [Fulvivirga ulvae]|uniref:ATP-binding protein n=1 Tax=Fulvivirga ulvae TaxID=2904245 RepID=UPI001F4533CE|nr:ATP-binding protein [Fulvivirga ulvae]UII31311.1 ATP-binding protein [Fulvivirga ulvae]